MNDLWLNLIMLGLILIVWGYVIAREIIFWWMFAKVRRLSTIVSEHLCGDADE